MHPIITLFLIAAWVVACGAVGKMNYDATHDWYEKFISISMAIILTLSGVAIALIITSFAQVSL